jgi:hypothetical protein
MFVMQCEEFEDRLNRLLDHRLSPDDDESLASHAHDCEDCASLFHAQQRLFAGLRMGSAQPSVDLATRVVSQRHTEVSRRGAAWRNAGWAVLLASAASLGGLALMALKTGDNPPSLVKKDPVQGTKHGPGLAIAGIGGTEKDRIATHERADEKFEEYFVVLENFASQISDSKEFDEVSESLEPSIKPIRSSFGLAIDALRRTLPRGKDSRATKPDSGASWLPDVPVIS